MVIALTIVAFPIPAFSSSARNRVSRFGVQLADSVVADPREDVKRPDPAVEIAGRLAEVRDSVQSPVGFDELTHLNVVRDRCLSELLTPALEGQEVLSVGLAVEGSSASACAFAPPHFPPAVVLAV